MATLVASMTASQLLAHLVGDYVIQSDEMAVTKTRATRWAAYHAVTYGLPFLALTRSPIALAFIVVTHFVVDRWRLARFLCWTKNFVFSGWTWTSTSAFVGWFLALGAFRGVRVPDAVWSPHRRPWSECTRTGYPDVRDAWMTVWLMIIADNVCHIAFNAVALWAWP